MNISYIYSYLYFYILAEIISIEYIFANIYMHKLNVIIYRLLRNSANK